MCECLSLLCGGSLSDKIKAAFLIFDINDTESLEFDELTEYLSTVFRIVFGRLIDNFPEFKRVTLLDFALKTSRKCFIDLGIPPSGEVSVDDFLGWLLEKKEGTQSEAEKQAL